MELSQERQELTPFASPADYAECERLHREYGTTYYFASRCFPAEVRRATHAVYGFVRVPDEWVDNPGDMCADEQYSKLQNWRSQLKGGLEGRTPEDGVMRAFVDAVRQFEIPLEEPLCFLDAMESDLRMRRYQTYDDLRTYMRGSASAVGAMMLAVMEHQPTQAMREAAMILGEAMQMTNFLRDVGEDCARGRLYLPLEDLAAFGVDEQEIERGELSPRFVSLMEFEIARTRALFAASDPGIEMLSGSCRKAVLLARILYSRILDVIEANRCDVFSQRARTTGWQKLAVAAQVTAFPRLALGSPRRRHA